MEISKNHDLTKLNTFGVSAMAKFFAELRKDSDLDELLKILEFKQSQKLFLGYGSNILFTKDFDGIVILNRIKGIEILDENDDFVLIKAKGGEKWDNLVQFSVEHNFWGLENLSLIPSSVGASPVQNIGAYGSEVKDVIEKVEVADIETGEKKVFSKKECEFGYRESIFKNKFKGKYFILSVVFKLNKNPNPNISYKTLEEYLAKNKNLPEGQVYEIKNPKDVSYAVSCIRREKLPDPNILGNAGSFFKNVFVDPVKFEELKKNHPEIPSYDENDMLKIPTAWLIEQCGPSNEGTSWKGKRIGNVGVYEKHSLILVNYGGATGQEIKNLADQIITSVSAKFGITLVPEVNIL